MHPDLNTLIRAPYFDTYLKTLDSANTLECLRYSKQKFIDVISNLSNDQLDYSYQSHKWSIKELIVHLIDTEIIFNYRALRIGRESVAQKLEGFDENAYASQANLDNLNKADLIAFFSSVRDSSMLLYKTFTSEQLNRIGEASNHNVQAKALFLINAGHTLHHLNIINERYLTR
ncbi:DinB family protein [Salibacteraceae bacterium]|jgi:uncharacterized damage-inducible protein DinB|nr:DinB family protein [Salibacteraceae bacterium]HAQ71497.1 damage-inducible protein DinB [Flavobacteriales bacterium]MDB0002225.1 DinB family protein [Salibacteraceae bacterium]MDB4105170.1 DinB family protein [Salibacteraceae bacterium]MDB9708908.1 DinB family protein [Salibacteraceae bacterium]